MPIPVAPSLVLDAAAVVLATGGSGQLYAITTNPRESRGEGIAIAARAGAIIADAEFVQFHPTAINIGRDPAPLATEVAARRRRAADQRPRRALHARGAPRRRAWPARHRRPRRLPRGDERTRRLSRLPPARARVSRRTFPPCSPLATRPGIDPRASRSRLRRRPTTTWAASSPTRTGAPRIDGLWACGEVASTGAHGANRLASNSLLEAVVFGARVAATSPSGCRRAKLLRSTSPQRRPTLRLGAGFASACRRCAGP